MFWREHSYIAYSTTYIGYLTLRRKSAFLRRKKISCFGSPRGGQGSPSSGVPGILRFPEPLLQQLPVGHFIFRAILPALTRVPSNARTCTPYYTT